ncbi:MAG: homocysteine S-methyltransferase family protein [Acidobacteria bacterium]|uniref:Homocysteine S-methyltransferase family protein n=1 Tax=Candidatus Polarisedimenticola svalbardensis TaxID=2886004 RepID=A0A8J6Y1Y4_9BACT|nr:homocysteine S-methyltransferase family protein [Candidatus Polarisedimenticola svalbardensis]
MMTHNTMKALLDNNDLILMEAAIVEPLRRGGVVDLHPTLVNAPLVYDETGRRELRSLYGGYMAIAKQAGLPLMLCTPTWRANRERVEASGLPRSINRDTVGFLRELQGDTESVRIGGLIGCRNDGYKPEQGLTAAEAESFHGWQVGEFAAAGVDYLIAETICTVSEAQGIARAMEKTGLPYIISFVIRRDGCILDGTSLLDGILAVEKEVQERPLGFMVNCAWPGFLRAEQQPPELFHRLIGFQANGSSLDHADLDNAEDLQAEGVSKWGQAMLKLNRDHGVKILGGCCGTGAGHLEYLVANRGREHV